MLFAMIYKALVYVRFAMFEVYLMNLHKETIIQKCYFERELCIRY
jgi:hypothetical protein